MFMFMDVIKHIRSEDIFFNLQAKERATAVKRKINDLQPKEEALLKRLSEMEDLANRINDSQQEVCWET